MYNTDTHAEGYAPWCFHYYCTVVSKVIYCIQKLLLCDDYTRLLPSLSVILTVTVSIIPTVAVPEVTTIDKV